MEITIKKDVNTKSLVLRHQMLEQAVVLLGEKLRGCTVYCTTKPCTTCTKLLIGCGVKHIVWKGDYDDDFASSLLKEYIEAEFYTDDHGYCHAISPDNAKSC